MGKNILEFVHDEDRDVAKSALFRRIKEGGKGGFTIYRFRSKNGEYKYLRVVTSVHLTNPEINGIILNAHDVTDLIRSENEKYLVMINTQETERQRLSRDLHDGVGQYLAATIMYMEILDPVVQSNLTDQDVELFHLAKQLLQKATKETRIVSHNIMPPSLKDFGFVDCLKGLIADLSHDNLIINLNIVPQYYEVDFLDTVSLTLFRSIQQLLNNSIEHGCATKIDLTITEKANETEVEVRDNGKGFDIEQLRGHDGIGLLSIQQRMNSVGGSVSIQSEIGKGTVIKISLKRR
jgi:signal transduction histidine kinase